MCQKILRCLSKAPGCVSCIVMEDGERGNEELDVEASSSFQCMSASQSSWFLSLLLCVTVAPYLPGLKHWGGPNNTQSLAGMKGQNGKEVLILMTSAGH